MTFGTLEINETFIFRPIFFILLHPSDNSKAIQLWSISNIGQYCKEWLKTSSRNWKMVVLARYVEFTKNELGIKILIASFL